MIYHHEITLTKNDPTVSTIHDILRVSKGLVYQVEFLFPPGCAGLAHIAVFDGGHQCWPSTPGETYHTDGEKISFPDSYFKLIAPYQFEIWGYNLDDTYSHTVHIRIGLVTSDIFMARFLPTMAYEELRRIIVEETKVQEKRVEMEPEEFFPWID